MAPIRHRDFQVREESLALPSLPGTFRFPDLGHAQGTLEPECSHTGQGKEAIALNFGFCAPDRAPEANKGRKKA